MSVGSFRRAKGVPVRSWEVRMQARRLLGPRDDPHLDSRRPAVGAGHGRLPLDR